MQLKSLLCEERHILKTIKSSDGTHIQQDSDGDAYFKVLSLRRCLEKMKTHFIAVIEELKRTRSSWKMKLEFHKQRIFQLSLSVA